MRIWILLSLVALMTLSPVLAEEVVLDSIPGNAEDFVQLRDRLAKTPEGGAACFIAALLSYSQSKEVGMQCLTLALDKRNVGQGEVYKGYAPSSSIMYHVNRLDGYKVWPYLGFAYLKGGKAANDYKVSAPYTVVCRRQKNSGSDESGQVKIFIPTDGFRPRPITMKRNDKGIWKALECSSMFLNVNPPKSRRVTDDL